MDRRSDYAVGHRDGQEMTETFYAPLIALADALAAAVEALTAARVAANNERLRIAWALVREQLDAYRAARQP